jgi:hypothetical protein
VRAQGSGVPLGAIHVIDRHERRLTPHRQANVIGLQLGIQAFPERGHRLPLLVAIRQRDARVFMDARDLVDESELDLALVDGANHRCRADVIRRARKRNMSLAREQARRRIQPYPTGTRHKDLGPGMQIGEVLFGPRGAVERFLVRGQLHQVAGDEACSETKMAHDLHQQPCTVATRTFGEVERLFAGLHAGLHAHDVLDILLQALVQGDKKIDDALGFARYGFEPMRQTWPRLGTLEIGF